MTNEVIINKIVQQGVLPLYYHADVGVSLAIAKALYQAGVRVIEYTNRGEQAIENFKLLVEARNNEMPEMILGIGTIKTTGQASAFIEAGADFIICPGLNTAVAKLVHEKNMLWVPGCMTPSEIMQAEAAGAGFIKLFPGNLLGPSFVSAIKELFPQMKFMPTGGVEVEEKNLSAWFKSGVVAVGMGSKLITKEVVENKQFELLAENTVAAIELIRKIR
ncbi:bifunctional 4-hydroxy-2-oxoglutarate aldolase/2-dehydro-3-deoxy-phosphogluconate aldolase [Gynurincola endophyticus]|uniref:bifunctional 4-hydroxy-2-oxoglutarate aldolase/2-dehydro-3-deoxy-phosphogluconate aldolase n=1 Tax=Gynurincola endophyticus TaxID=2479004 RepID=UPI000F8E36C8|nr:bifunctional 4-hydroxy-2-oxoglutarate aldolase/2-dehydro-3-deoxy-phosphogluconate aldolase [Gynurincola endophyticus]